MCTSYDQSQQTNLQRMNGGKDCRGEDEEAPPPPPNWPLVECVFVEQLRQDQR